MVGVRAARRVNVPGLQHAPAALAGMEENVVQPAPAQQQFPRGVEIQPPPPQPSLGADDQLRILMRGPVHEAFAQQSELFA